MKRKVEQTRPSKRQKSVDDDGESISVGSDLRTKKKQKLAVKEHKDTLEKLRDTDPEFYKFLKDEDAEVFDFDVSDADEDDDNENDEKDEEEDEDSEKESTTLEPQYSDESSDSEQRGPDMLEDEQISTRKVSITSELIEKWQRQQSEILDGSNTKNYDKDSIKRILDHIADAFRAVVAQIGGEPDAHSGYRIDDAATFNAVIRLCFSIYPTMWQRISGNSDLFSMTQAKRRSLRPHVKPHLHNLIVFLHNVQNEDVLNAVLRHLTHVAGYYSLFGTLSRMILKELVSIWSTKREDSRLLAFLSIMKLLRYSPQTFLSIVLKKMYFAYVRNTKLVTPSTWGLINFMQRSYAEICGMDKQAAYQFAFVYIRQLAIHLRNAIMTKKKEQIATVYNWQFVQCLYLWARLLSTHAKDDIMKPLVYPLIQIALGCIRLIPTARYIPLRFHCVRAILVLAQESDLYVPVVPAVLEVFQLIDFSKKHQRQSLKPFDFDCMLKLSESQLVESALKPAVVEGALELLVEILNIHAGSLAFPELAFICCSRLKSFSKSCHIPALVRPIKELTGKISEHITWLEQQRRTTALNLAKLNGDQRAFELRLTLRADSPLGMYYEIFKTMKERERKLKLETGGEMNEEEDTPRDQGKNKKKTSKRNEQVKMKTKSKRVEKTKKIRPVAKVNEAEDDDIVQDLNLSDFD